MVLPRVRWFIMTHPPLKSKPRFLRLGTGTWLVPSRWVLTLTDHFPVALGVLRPLRVFRASGCPGNNIKLADGWEDRCGAGR